MKTRKSKRTKKVLVFDKSRDFQVIFASAKQTSIMLGVTPQAVSSCCNGLSIMCKDYYLRYLHPNMKISSTNMFETIGLIEYDEFCGEKRFYFNYDKSGKRKSRTKQKMTADQMRSLETNVKNKALARLYKFYPDNLRVIAHNGWFIDIYSNRYFRKMLKTKLDGENIEIVNKAIAKHYETYAKEIIEALCDRHPQRSNFIEESFSAYNAGFVRLAILGLLTQVDGICEDTFKEHFFIKRKSNNQEYIPAVTNDLIQVQNDFFKIFITPILHECPIFVHYSKLYMYPSKLNRHNAMHGTDINYGDKENFLKCLSLFKYMSDILYFSDICTKNGRYIERYMYPNSDWVLN